MANQTETSSTYSEASFVTSKNDLKHKFYRQDVSEMIVPVVEPIRISIGVDAMTKLYRRLGPSSKTTAISQSMHNPHTLKKS